MTTRATQLALLIDQLMAALQAKPPVFAGIFLSDGAAQLLAEDADLLDLF